MSIIVNNTDNQLNINNNGVLDVYAVKSIKSVSKAVDASGNYYISINFIANDKNNSLRIYLKDVSSPVTWTNDLAGSNAALADIRDWLSEVIEVEISEANDSILIYGFDGVNNQPVSVDSSGQVNTNVHDGSGNAITSTTVGPDTGLDVNIIGGVTLAVNLDAADDQVGIYGYTNVADPTSFAAIKVDASGHLKTDIMTMPATFAEDSAHVSGNTGAFVLGVRNDSNTAMTSANGDYSPIAVNDKGAVAIQDGGNSITVDAVNLDVRDLSQLIDTVKIYGSNGANPVFTDVAGNIGITDNSGSITVDSNAAVRTATVLRTSANSSVAAGAYSVSFASVGTVDATVGGATLKVGETINFDAGGINNTLGAISYNSSAAGAELLIITIT